MPAAINIAKEAGDVLLSYFQGGFSHRVSTKADQSPVTQADIAANQLITTQLIKINADIPVLSEENHIPDFSVRKQWSRYWLIDPLDGTRGFIRHSPEFCVNIALIDHHQPVLGVIYSPVDHHCFYASQNNGAFFLDTRNGVIQKIMTSEQHESALRLLTGRFDQNDLLQKRLTSVFYHMILTQMNSALKFSVIARGMADIYVRLGSTSEWDTAAGQCIVEAAGGSVVDFQGRPLQYNAKSSLINPSFIAMGDKSRCEQYLTGLREIP